MCTSTVFRLALRYTPLMSIAVRLCPSYAAIAKIVYKVVRFTVGELMSS